MISTIDDYYYYFPRDKKLSPWAWAHKPKYYLSKILV
jgi:hypothetical protein